MENKENGDLVLRQWQEAREPLEKMQARQLVVDYISQLLASDFAALVQLLYRVDVAEQKLRKLLKDNPGRDAAELITDLLIERLEEKKRTRNSFRNDDPIPDDEKW